MKRVLICAVVVLGLPRRQRSVAAVAQEQTRSGKPARGGGGHEIRNSGRCIESRRDGEPPSALPATKKRRDRDQIQFRLRVRPDPQRPAGRLHRATGLDELYAEGLTVAELRNAVRQAYATTLHDPEVTIALKDFEKPYFIATGAVAHPGKYELRGDATVTEGVALAGGFTEQAKHSEVVLFRRISEERTEARVLNVKQMLNSRNLAEDFHLRAGDLLYVPQNRISKIRRYLPTSSLSTYVNPTQF